MNIGFMFHRGLLIASKASPKICLIAGLTGFVTTVVLSSIASSKVGSVINENKEKKDNLNRIIESDIPKLDEDEKKEVAKNLIECHVDTALKVVKLYAPTVIVGAISIGLLVKGHNILNKRNLALVSAYKVLDGKFKTYKLKVAEKVTGEIAKEVEDEIMEEDSTNQYYKVFDKHNRNWSCNHDFNLMFIKSQQNYANDLLRTDRGHVFLNEVYDMLGFDRTPAGAIVGWTRKKSEYIDFKITRGPDTYDDNGGLLSNLYLDFDVDGIMYDMI